MKIFLYTSSLFKLYHREADTVVIEQIFSKVNVTNVYLSEITKVEFASAIWKKVRTNEIKNLPLKLPSACLKLTVKNIRLLPQTVLLLNRQKT